MSGVALEPIAQWLLLDGADAARALTTLRQGFAGLPSFKLFDGTEFEPVSEHGPVLVDMRDSPALASLVGFVVLIPTALAMMHLRSFGPWVLLGTMAVVWVADIAAYFSGRAFGRHKLAPSISPGKTWEGALGGALGVLLFGFGILVAFGARQPGGAFVIALALLAWTAISVIGDLFESLLKRQAGLKDSGSILPGHGGILPAAKVTPEIARIRGVPEGQDVVSPARHSEFSDVDSMLDFVEKIADAIVSYIKTVRA